MKTNKKNYNPEQKDSPGKTTDSSSPPRPTESSKNNKTRGLINEFKERLHTVYNASSEQSTIIDKLKPFYTFEEENPHSRFLEAELLNIKNKYDFWAKNKEEAILYLARKKEYEEVKHFLRKRSVSCHADYTHHNYKTAIRALNKDELLFIGSLSKAIMEYARNEYDNEMNKMKHKTARANQRNLVKMNAANREDLLKTFPNQINHR